MYSSVYLLGLADRMFRDFITVLSYYLKVFVVEKSIGGRHNTRDKMVITTRLRIAEECLTLPRRGFITTRYLQ